METLANVCELITFSLTPPKESDESATIPDPCLSKASVSSSLSEPIDVPVRSVHMSYQE
jgi:hypothetical protein